MAGAHFGRAPSCGGQAKEACQINETIITYSCNLSIGTYKCFDCCGIEVLEGWMLEVPGWTEAREQKLEVRTQRVGKTR